MTTASLPLAARARFDVGRALRAGALLGFADCACAMLVYVAATHRTTTTRLWQGVARALVGQSSFDGGLATVALGLAMHFAIAFTWAMVYAILYHNSAALRRLTRTAAGTIVAGALFGAFVQIAMSMVIVPLTLAGPGSRTITTMWFVGLAIHMIAVGQPPAWIVRDRTA